MPRLDADTWAMIRAEWEADERVSFGMLAEKYGVHKAAVGKKAKEQGWTKSASAAVDRLVDVKVDGLVDGGDPLKRAAAIEGAADRRASIVLTHRAEWEAHRNKPISDFEGAKLAKITAETIRIRQDGERKAWGLDKPAADAPGLTIAWPLPKGPLDR